LDRLLRYLTLQQIQNSEAAFCTSRNARYATRIFYFHYHVLSPGKAALKELALALLKGKVCKRAKEPRIRYSTFNHTRYELSPAYSFARAHRDSERFVRSGGHRLQSLLTFLPRKIMLKMKSMNWHGGHAIAHTRQ